MGTSWPHSSGRIKITHHTIQSVPTRVAGLWVELEFLPVTAEIPGDSSWVGRGQPRQSSPLLMFLPLQDPLWAPASDVQRLT